MVPSSSWREPSCWNPQPAPPSRMGSEATWSCSGLCPTHAMSWEGGAVARQPPAWQAPYTAPPGLGQQALYSCNSTLLTDQPQALCCSAWGPRGADPIPALTKYRGPLGRSCPAPCRARPPAARAAHSGSRGSEEQAQPNTGGEHFLPPSRVWAGVTGRQGGGKC